MKKTIFTLLTLSATTFAMGQISKPISDQILIGKITKSTINHYDFQFQGSFGTCWVNQYHGKYYSNYPFKVVFSKQDYKVYKHGKLVQEGTFAIPKITNTKSI